MTIEIKNLGITDYSSTFDKMIYFTDKRGVSTSDEIWITQHYPVFTQGQAGKAEHILLNSNIPVVDSDRGGQVTYHGPGQIVIYILVNIRRRNIGVRQMVSLIEKSVASILNSVEVDSIIKSDAPGVYIKIKNKIKKIASLGLRIKKGCTYHGLSLNIDMDLTPFSYINPCGYRGLEMTQWIDVVNIKYSYDIDEIAIFLADKIKTEISVFGYNY